MLFRSRSTRILSDKYQPINALSQILSRHGYTFCPLNSRRIKQSRTLEQSDQAIKDDFHRSRFLVPVANAFTGNMYVTTPWPWPRRDYWIKLAMLEAWTFVRARSLDWLQLWTTNSDCYVSQSFLFMQKPLSCDSAQTFIALLYFRSIEICTGKIMGVSCVYF